MSEPNEDTHLKLLEENRELRRRLEEFEATSRPKGELERQQAEEELRASQLILEHSRDSVLLIRGEDGRILKANSAAVLAYGYTKEELLSLTIRDLRAPETVEPNAEQMAKADDEGMLFETIHRRKDGSTFPVEVSSRGVMAGGTRTLISMVRDISVRKQAEDELRKLAAVVQHSKELINLATLDGQMVFLNEAGREMLGIDPQDVAKANILEVIPENQMKLVKEKLLPALLKGGEWKGELQYRNLKTGQLTDVHAVTFPIQDLESGNVSYFANTSTDITERKRAEEERLRLERQILHAQKLESLGVLAGGIAHDFNNLLMGVLGHADLALLELSEDSPLREHLTHVKTTAVRLSEIAKQMLAYSGKGRFVVEPLNLSSLVSEITELLQVSLPKKVALRLDLVPDLPALQADASQIRQVVMNLITNAADAIGEEGGLVTLRTGVVSADRVYLTQLQWSQDLPEGEYAYLEISDTGCGMTKEVQEKIFDPFFTTKSTGRGLGLAVVQGIVNGHNGAIKVYSEPEKGTTFKILLPCASGEEQITGQKPSPAPQGRWGAGETVLVVDDEETVRTVAGLMLKKAGYSVFAATSGEEALAMLREHAQDVHVVLLDLSMPKMNGMEAFVEIRRIAPALPVILCSGYNEQDATRQFTGQGLADFVQKPYDFQTLTKKVGEVIARESGSTGGKT